MNQNHGGHSEESNNKEFHQGFNRAAEVKGEPPRPLTREIPPGEEFPIEALGDCIGDAVMAIHRCIQAPLAICAQSILGAIALVIQAFANILLPIGEGILRPLGLYLIAIALSGDRKTSTDGLALGAVRAHEIELRATYGEALQSYACDLAAWKQQTKQILNNKDYPGRDTKRDELEKLGEAPEAPWFPMRTCNEPTYEGLVRLFDEGWPSLGLFSDEASQFVGSFAMNQDNRLKSAGALSDLWDGKSIRRARAADGPKILPGRRLSLHLMMQPLVAQKLFGDPLLRDQGLHSRLLTVMPPSLQGTRLSSKESAADNFSSLSSFSIKMADLLRRDLPIEAAKQKPGEQPPSEKKYAGKELLPRSLPFSDEAKQLWVEYTDHVEAQLGPDGEFEVIRGLANKLPEHAARLAGVLALFDAIEAKELSADYYAKGIKLADYYAKEAIRIYHISQVNSELALAQKLLDWLKRSWKSEPEDHISLPDIYTFAPVVAIRDKEAALKMALILQDHGHLEKLDGPVVVNGENRREVWRIIK